MTGKEPAIEDMSVNEARRELGRLVEEISTHDEAYYQNDSPIISDGEYDILRQRNLAIEAIFPNLTREDSPSNKIGAALSTGFTKVHHARPMLSLSNLFSEDDLRDFLAGIRRFLKELTDDPDIELGVSSGAKN